MQKFASFTQAQVDKIFLAAAVAANKARIPLAKMAVEETGLNVPKLVDVEMIDGKWAIALQYIEGKTLETLIEEHPEKIDEYLEQRSV